MRRALVLPLVLALHIFLLPSIGLAQPARGTATTRAATQPLKTIDAPADFPKPTRVSFKVEKASTLEVVQALCEKTGVTAAISGRVFAERGPGSWSFDIRDRTFLEALHEICATMDGAPQFFRGPSGLTLDLAHGFSTSLTHASMRGRSIMSGPAVEVGPFMFIATNVLSQDAVDVSKTRAGRSLLVAISGFYDPALQVCATSSTLEVTEATDSNGQSLVPKPQRLNEPIFDSSTFGMKMWEIQATLAPRARRGGQLRKLKGIARAVVVVASEKLEIDDILQAKETEKTFAGIRCKVGPCRATANSYQIPLTIFRDQHPEEEWAQIRQLIQQTPPRLLDSKGAALWLAGPRDRSAPGDLQQNLEFTPERQTQKEPAGAPAKLVWDVPTKAKELRIPVEFENLPLP